MPLLSVSTSVLLCISTLLESGNHYSRMFTLTDSNGRPLFECISISLVCDDCLRTDFPEKCTHKLASMPRWLSSAKMEVVKSLLSEDPAMLLRESMGVSADQSCKAFPSADIDKFLDKPGIRIPFDEFEPLMNTNTNHFIVAVDPAGGGASAFAVCSMCQLPNGGVVVRAPLPCPHTYTHCLRFNGKLPRGSSRHNSDKRSVNVTYESGAWQRCFTNRGVAKGNTRFCKSSA